VNNQELKDIIKKLAGEILSKKDTYEEPTPEDQLPITTKYSRFDILNKFPEMIIVLESLLTNDFELFLKDIHWVAPKPSTFKIILINEQHFFLMFDPRSWTAQVEGKKYYLEELRESELASESISRILRYGEIKSGTPKSNKEEPPTEDTQDIENFEQIPATEEPPTEEPEA
jgi:hypothetical protein